MYTANRRQKKYKIFLKFMLFLVPLMLIVAGVIWFIFIRNNNDIASSFSKENGQVYIAKPSTKIFSNEMFKITLLSTWEANGKKNPYSDQVYYEFQSKEKGNDNRWIRIYVDIYPKSLALNRLQPVTVVDNKFVITGNISDECSTFTGAPGSTASNAIKSDTWMAKWNGIDFVCDMTNPQNVAGTASVEEGLGTTFINSNNIKHKYFFMYIDHNVRPDYQLFVDALKSFETI